MYKAFHLGIIAVFFLTTCTTNMGQDKAHTNKLINETSPYLLQHAHNPVNWQPWGQEALKEAQEQDKLIVVSIGYAACHWCHVMEHESFEDSVIAAKMNANYVSIKVDREERPDIDQIYMDAAQLLTGRGGWPLNVITLPDGRPIFAGTYFPKENWAKVLDYFAGVYQNEREKALEQAEKVTKGIAENEMPTFNEQGMSYSLDSVAVIQSNFMRQMDMIEGGREGAPKFPMPSAYEAMLVQDYFMDDPKLREAVKVTLDKMADGGIYDHLGGGFARYSTDAEWIVPHFEKMLYDNAQLISLYSHGYQVFRDAKYEQAVRETIEFCNRELSDPDGGFYSSLDADSEGEEGKFYVWDEDEIDSLLMGNAEVFKEYYGVTRRGNFEGKNILLRSESKEKLASKFDLSVTEVSNIIDAGKATLMKTRDTRIRPGLDDKVLTSWNALMILGLVDAHFAFGDVSYLKRAQRAGEFLIKKQVQESGQILRNYKAGRSTINGFLDDYAFTILAFVKLYEATFDEKWIYSAKELKNYVDDHFYDPESQMYYYTADNDEKLIARKMELNDNVIPGSNSAMAHALFQLGQYFYQQEDLKRVEQMVANSLQNLVAYPHYYSNWARLYMLLGNQHYEVAVVGDNAESLRSELAQEFLPNKILLGGKDEGTLELLKGKAVNDKTFIYVCTNKSCKLPVTEASKALEQMGKAY